MGWLSDLGDDIQGGWDDLRGKTQERQIEKGMGEQQNLYAQALGKLDESSQTNADLLQPYQQVGSNALSSLASKVGAGSYDAGTFNAQDVAAAGYDPALQNSHENFEFNYEQSPGYEFLKDQALTSATNSMASRGLGSSGAELKALQDRATNLAATDYDNQYSRALQTHQQNYNQFQTQESVNQNALNTAGQFNASATNDANQFNETNALAAYNANMDNKQNQFTNLNALAGYGSWAAGQGVSANNNTTSAYVAASTGQGDALLSGNIAKGDAAATGQQGILNGILTGAGALAGKTP